eukprot:Nitzschia sp. Nitz4//scaffold31_size150131//124180//125553//NITZ4_002850-RA/size150131-processed-gene-0.119-mRNA-1//1//CDS//3329547725//618//frame0
MGPLRAPTVVTTIITLCLSLSQSCSATTSLHSLQQESSLSSTSEATTSQLRKLQSSNNRVIAEAYECNEYLEELSAEELTAYKPIGYEIRVCIKPATPTRNRGIVMRSIDDFTWYRNYGAATQVAVKDKIDVDQTLLLCIAGQEVCSFKTKLADDLFYGSTNATITGAGSASLEVEPDDRRARQLFQENGGRSVFSGVIQWRSPRALQADTAAGGYAGSSTISIDFYVDKLDPPADYVPPEQDDAGWWEDAPGWLKALIIAGGILIILMALSLCFMCCWMCLDVVKDEVDDQEKRKSLKREDSKRAGLQRNPSKLREEQAPPSETREYDDDIPEEEEQQEEEFSPDGIITGVPEEVNKTTKPKKKDICFGEDKHPGTVALLAAVKKTVKKFPDVEYSPEQYRHIKKQLNGRTFYIRDDEDDPDTGDEVWREVTKVELVELVRIEYDGMQQSRKPQDP